MSKESIYKYRQILAHESGHAWRSCVGLDKPFEREALPNCNSRNFGESEESFNKRNKRCQIERQRIECQNNINATEWRAKVELAADHIQNIVMSDLGRSPFFRKCKPELTYGPVLVFFKSFSLGGGTNCNTREGFFGSEFKASYYDTKRDIRVEFGLKEKSYDINNCVLDLSLRKNQIKLENYIKKYNRNKHDK